MSTKRTDQPTKRHPTVDPERSVVLVQLRTLRALLFKKLLAGMTAEAREALVIYGLLSDMTDLVAGGQPITNAVVQPVIDAASVCLSGFREK